MSVISVASTASVWRGYEYFEAGAVKQLEKADDGLLIGKVSGSGKNIYDVTVDLAHPKRSSCTCPHAAGRRIVCKHMVAAYFTAFPLEAEQYIAELREAEDEQAEYEEQVIKCVLKMKKTELQETILQILFDGPDWQYEKFIEEYVDVTPSQN